jgi:hypothetical protein
LDRDMCSSGGNGYCGVNGSRCLGLGARVNRMTSPIHSPSVSPSRLLACTPDSCDVLCYLLTMGCAKNKHSMLTLLLRVLGGGGVAGGGGLASLYLLAYSQPLVNE